MDAQSSRQQVCHLSRYKVQARILTSVCIPNPRVKGHLKYVEAKFNAHLGGGASLHRHVVADLQAVSMMSEKLRVCSLNMPAAW